MSAAALVGALAEGEGRVEVVGSGTLADELRLLLGERVRPAVPEARPEVIIDTTGEALALIAALERVDDLGTVVLAGPVPSRSLDLDLYTDLHVRGLVLVGVPPDKL
jgi:hypothetical protein